MLSYDDDDDNDDADDDCQYWGPLSKGLRPREHEARWLGKHTEGTSELTVNVVTYPINANSH